MLTSVQKEILQTLINLYQSSNGKSIKGEDIAEVMNRNPGTIRNQMQNCFLKVNHVICLYR